jgi:hypothetical protein
VTFRFQVDHRYQDSACFIRLAVQADAPGELCHKFHATIGVLSVFPISVSSVPLWLNPLPNTFRNLKQKILLRFPGWNLLL